MAKTEKRKGNMQYIYIVFPNYLTTYTFAKKQGVKVERRLKNVCLRRAPAAASKNMHFKYLNLIYTPGSRCNYN